MLHRFIGIDNMQRHRHGHYIVAATRFLSGFYPWLRAETNAAVDFRAA